MRKFDEIQLYQYKSDLECTDVSERYVLTFVTANINISP